MYWEYRRIVPALDITSVKAIFVQEIENSDQVLVEHMWINEVSYDGENISGILINEPNKLTNVKNGDAISIPLDQLSDWLFAVQEKTYGGFTIHAIRSEMNASECLAHDNAWGLDFGDYNDILLVYKQKENPESLVEHPMSTNMKESF